MAWFIIMADVEDIYRRNKDRGKEDVVMVQRRREQGWMQQGRRFEELEVNLS